MLRSQDHGARGRTSIGSTTLFGGDTMKAAFLLAGAVVISCASPALADEYYVVQGPSHHCTVTTTRPADKEVVTQIGPMAFTSRVEAEDRIKQTKVCEDGTVGSSSSTTVIKEK